MKGILHWFKSSTKMKRWIFLTLVGIMLACYGLAEILVLKEVSFLEVGKIVAIFIIGFVSIILFSVYIIVKGDNKIYKMIFIIFLLHSALDLNFSYALSTMIFAVLAALTINFKKQDKK